MSETSFIPTKDKAYTSFQLLQGLKAVLHREEFRIAWFPNSLLNPEGMVDLACTLGFIWRLRG